MTYIYSNIYSALFPKKKENLLHTFGRNSLLNQPIQNQQLSGPWLEEELDPTIAPKKTRWWFQIWTLVVVWGTGWLLDVIGGVPLLGGGFKYCLFSPRTLRKWWNLTNIFFRWRWKHQLENDHRLDVNISKDWRFSTQCVLIGAWSTGEKDQRSLLATSCHGTHGNVIRDYFKRCGGCQKCW